MIILLDATPAIRQSAGIGRYAAELARGLAQCLAGDELRLFSSDPGRGRPGAPLDRLPLIERPSHPKLWRARIAWSSWTGGVMDREVGPGDVFHATDHVLPPLRTLASVFTLHDLTHVIAPGTQSAPNRMYGRAMIPRFLERAGIVVAVSESTRRGAIEHYGIAPAKVRTVLSGTPTGFEPAAPSVQAEVRQRLELPGRYLLSVGTFEPRKNHGLLFRALAEMNDPAARLVLVGKRGWKQAEFERSLRAARVAHQVVIREDVPNAELPAIYSGAELFLFPSHYEGFGFPMLEAMACGTPVLAADSSSLPEVAGGASRLLPADDAPAWASAIRELREDAGAREELRRRGFRRAQELTWERTAREMLAIYREAHDRRA